MTVYLLLGGNEGDVGAAFAAARAALEQRVGQIIKASSLHRTTPWGEFAPTDTAVADTMNAAEDAGSSVPDFLNQILIIETTLPPMALLDTTQAIEHELGRRRASSEGSPRSQVPRGAERTTLNDATIEQPRTYQSRTIDIDILFYGNKVVNTTQLTIPHPLIAQREFVLRPLAEVAPFLKHPITGLTAKGMLSALLHTNAQTCG